MCTTQAIMYFYYALMTVKIRVWWLPPVFITITQILQMVVGTGSNPPNNPE